ncbi:hypothetical protein [Clostridium cochlearium]|uniref:Uncharacterized protein n=1 Tax=Clostridium cochlearium TaxID=1494 RepID=A0ABY0QKQ7_CLOCO|nr:hypothetical protein [Clostridium cochlearium]MBV1816990.1 hypothetical protein [Bacteroidales bacterium MSK.15.36]NSJ90754.1 hypothetical protein [Coprococcus sp. MSK.21.13]MCG4570742.1 hypothetical protein [Clostridium cochlearium]MCG4579547.1 hypothetical protein [Clostridium cochlearium]MDU1443990.1 hypothetical protein [Clostridium cochlearium]
MNYIILFILKLLDCTISTFKTFFMIKERYLISSLCNAISQFFYLTLLVKVAKNNSIAGIIIICMATFLGSYFPMKKTNKDKIWIYNIIANSQEESKELADILRECNLDVYTNKGYNLDIDKILDVKVISNSRDDSRIIENLIPINVTYHVLESKKVSF